MGSFQRWSGNAVKYSTAAGFPGRRMVDSNADRFSGWDQSAREKDRKMDSIAIIFGSHQKISSAKAEEILYFWYFGYFYG